MSCMASTLTGLVDFWAMRTPEGGLGSVVSGSVRGTAMTLRRSHRQSGTVLDAALGWTAEAGTGRSTYNGGGIAMLPSPAGTSSPGATGPLPGSALPTLEETGEAITIAVRWWALAGAVPGVQGPPETDGPLAHQQQVLGLSGWHDNAGGGTYAGTAFVVLSDDGELPGTLAVRQSDSGDPTTIAAGVVGETACIVVVLVREAGGVRARAYVDGGLVGDVGGVLLDAGEGDFVTRRPVFGSVLYSHGGVTQAAVWRRALGADELLSLGGSLDCLESLINEIAGPGSPNPLLTPAGLSALTTSRIRRLDQRGVLTSDGNRGRHTRLTHDRVPRVYELVIDPADGSDVQLVREALRATRGGAGVTRWRHPVDDPAPPAEDPVGSAPRWRILNGASAAVSRRRGGALGETTLILEEIVDPGARRASVPDGPSGGGAVSFDNLIGGGAIGIAIRPGGGGVVGE